MGEASTPMTNDPAISEILEWMRTLEHLKDAHDVDLAGIAEWTDPLAEADKLTTEHCDCEDSD